MTTFYRFIIALLSLALVLSLWQRGKEEREKTNEILENYMAQEAAMIPHLERMDETLKESNNLRQNKQISNRLGRLIKDGDD